MITLFYSSLKHTYLEMSNSQNFNIIKNAMLKQPVINIGMIGHVSNGKSEITFRLTGIRTQRHSSEKQKNITIKLGYANTKIYKCSKCSEPECYQPGPSEEFSKKCKICNNEMELITHISFVDCPGHSRFMSTMINGTTIMDTTILVEAVNQDILLPQPQTREHIKAITVGNIPNSIICLNKWDLIKPDQGMKKVKSLKEALKNTVAEESPMIPISATLDINVDVLCDYLSQLPLPIRDLDKPPKMIVVRSFNINKPGVFDDLCGGVIGGSILHGKIDIGMDVVLLPGYCTENKDENNTNGSNQHKTRWRYKPLCAKVLSIQSGNNELEYAIPGGLIGIQLDLDPALTTDDGLIGQVLTPLNMGSCVYEDLALSYKLLDNSISVKKEDALLLNINACNVTCSVKKIFEKEGVLKLKLDKPISVSIEDKVTICYDGKIFGMGNVVEGIKSQEEL